MLRTVVVFKSRLPIHSKHASLFKPAGMMIQPAAASFTTTTTAKPSLAKEATGETKLPHRSNAEELIAKVPVIQVKGSVAVCDGGGLVFFYLNFCNNNDD